MITKPNTPCTEWHGCRTEDGYGRKRDKATGKVEKAHRWVLAQLFGWEVLRGKVVMHLCDNPPCVRLDHLRIGTQAENNADMAAKGRLVHRNAVKTHCKNGHPFDDVNTYIHPDGSRRCRACSREYQARQYAARRKVAQ